MALSPHAPIIFLACVNSFHNGKRLRYLANERKSIAKIISSAQKTANLQTVEKTSYPNTYLFDLLQKNQFKNKIRIVHFTGHADSDHLRIESEKMEASVHRDELSSLLTLLPNLQAVFLSGCATPGLVKSLIKRDIPAIFVTESTDKSTHASELVKLFYKTLGKGKSLWQCLKVVQEVYPNFQPRPLNYDLETDQFICKDLWGSAKAPWGMYYLMDNLQALSKRIDSSSYFPYVVNSPKGLKSRLKSAGKIMSYAASAITLALIAVGVTWFLYTSDGLNMWLSF